MKLPALSALGQSLRGSKNPIEVGHTRLIVTGVMFGLAFVVIAGRLVDVTMISGAYEKRMVRTAQPISTERADIVDRNGLLVATSIATSSVFADPRKILDPADAAKKIARVLPDVNEGVIRDRLASGKSFVYIRRNLTPRQQFEVNRLGIPGISFQREDKRVYPQGPVLSQVLGFADVDNHGLSGIEKFFDDRLRNNEEPLQLSIDMRVQHAMRQELIAGVAKFKAIGAAGIVMDLATNELLAMVSLPDFDPNEPGTAPEETRFNRATLGVYEMGSTFKIFNTAMALDNGVISLSSAYPVGSPIHIGRFTIKDDHPMPGSLNVPDIFKYSSNIGSVKIALDSGIPMQRAFLSKLGLTQTAKIELPEIGHPQIPVPWRQVNLMTIAFGHGMAVSPLQLVTAVSAVANGGVFVTPTLVKRPEGQAIQGTRVMSSRTSDIMRRLMRLVVMEGTGKNAAVPGYVIGGKTGTAEKIGARGGYNRKANVTSFVGAFPMNNPRYAVLVTLDEPQPLKETYGFATSGWNATPVAGKVVARIGPLLGLPPSDENSNEVKQSTLVAFAPTGLAPAPAAAVAPGAAQISPTNLGGPRRAP